MPWRNREHGPEFQGFTFDNAILPEMLDSPARTSRAPHVPRHVPALLASCVPPCLRAFLPSCLPAFLPSCLPCLRALLPFCPLPSCLLPSNMAPFLAFLLWPAFTVPLMLRMAALVVCLVAAAPWTPAAQETPAPPLSLVLSRAATYVETFCRPRIGLRDR